MIEADSSAPGPPVLHPDPRCELLILVLMAGFVLRSMHRLRVAFEGGLDAALVLLDLLAAERKSRLEPGTGVGPPSPPRRSITAVGVATGIPRETVRRLLAGLAAAGWLEVANPTGYVTSEQTREWFGQTQAPEVLCEFVWVADQVKAAQQARGEAVGTLFARQRWDLALASAWQAPTDSPLPQLARVLEDHRRRLGADAVDSPIHPVDGFLYRHLKRLYRGFDGDLLMPLLIGEIAHRNVSALAWRDGAEDRLLRFSADPGAVAPDTQAQFLRCNTNSLSLSTGVPEATVRRKVARLAALGFVRVAPDRALTIDAANIRAHSAAIDAETLADMLETYETLGAFGRAV
jgi:hypothetical protein